MPAQSPASADALLLRARLDEMLPVQDHVCTDGLSRLPVGRQAVRACQRGTYLRSSTSANPGLPVVTP